MGPLLQIGQSIRANLRAFSARPFSQLLIASDSAGWSLDEDARALIATADQLGFPAYLAPRPLRSLPQCVHYTSHFSLADPRVFASKHRISVDYYHGKPAQDPSFRQVFEALRANRDRIHRVRISYSGMKPVVAEAGIPEERIHLIPIGINPELFRAQDAKSKSEARRILGIPESALVVGSFQKDGQGWGEGLEPKWVKGPDVFLRAVTALKKKFPEIFVLLTGPARGFVKRGLEAAGIPYKHFLLEHYAEIGRYYQALDLYLVASREEGGPKAVLESMISGIPLVTTKVGQAIDLVESGRNALTAEIDDADGLAAAAEKVILDNELRETLRANGFRTAAGETPAAQLPRWKNYFAGFVETE